VLADFSLLAMTEAYLAVYDALLFPPHQPE
jgi:hypothetical protein